MKNPEIIAELKRIAVEHDGILNPKDVVRAARAKSSPLHSQFEWSDAKAGHEYRLWQARQLIRVTVEYIGSGEDVITAHVFVSLTSDRKPDGGYRSIASVMTDAEQRKQLFEDAVEEMERFQAKYAELKELASVFDAMRRVSRKNAVPV